jgi:polar amino acid transport system permease protein
MGTEVQKMASNDQARAGNEPTSASRRVYRRHYGRYIAAVATLAFVAFFVRSMAEGQIEWRIVGEFLTVRTILYGLGYTVLMAVVAMIVGISLGLLFAVMRMSQNPVTRGIAMLYLWIFRGSPQLLQLFLWFNLALVFPMIVIPGLYSGRTVDIMTPFLAAVLGLGISQGAYTSEVIRAGILSVDRGQTESAQSIGMGKIQILRHIVLPQAMKVIIPPIGNEFIGMLKATSLASQIQYTEVLNAAQRIYWVNNRIMELLFVATFWYLVAVSLSTIGQSFLEKRAGRGTRPG